jgi:hypothetical protein
MYIWDQGRAKASAPSGTHLYEDYSDRPTGYSTVLLFGAPSLIS